MQSIEAIKHHSDLFITLNLTNYRINFKSTNLWTSFRFDLLSWTSRGRNLSKIRGKMTEYQVKTENTLAHGFINEEEMKEERKLDDKDWFCWPQQFTYVSNDSVDYIKDIFYVAIASFEGNRATKQTTPKNDKKCKGNVTKCWDERAFNRCTVCQSQQIFIFSSKTIIPFFFRPKYLLHPAP